MTGRFTTASGAVYRFKRRDDGSISRLMREEGEMNPRMRLPNDEWLDVNRASDIIVGHPAGFQLRGGLYRFTTPVVSIEEDE